MLSVTMPGSKLNGSGPVLEPIHKGWLTKSPPEPKLMSPWRFLVRAKWRRRYFVLHKPPGSLPDHFALDYFEDDSLNKRLGTIDLELTEEIISPLNSSQYDYLFLIKTKFKRKDRRYFLAVDTEDEMNKWIDCLCQVCGLKEQDEVPDPAILVPPMDEPVAPSRPSLTGTLNSQPSDGNLAADNSVGGSYVKLDTCFSRTDDDRTAADTSDTMSIPDIPPPPVPNENYDVLPRRTSGEDFYKVPPRREDVYDYPPSHNHHENGPYVENPNDFYDVPRPPVRTEHSMNMLSSGEAPPRPPKPGDSSRDQPDSQYINLPSRSPTVDEPPRPPPRPSLGGDSIYDIPPPTSSGNNSILSMSPPAPSIISTGPNSHSYVNTNKTSTGYTPMNRISQEQPTYDVLYTRSPKKENGFAPSIPPRRPSESDDVYQVPPSNKPVNPQPPPTPARPENTLTKYSKPIDQNTCEVFSTSRTMSFRRAGVRQTPSPRPRNRQGQGNMPRDASFGLGIPTRTGSSCSSSDEDDDNSSLDRSSSSQLNAGPAPPRRTTPPTGKPQETELQYLDLDLTSRNLTTPEKRVPKPAPPSNSATEYKEIDFVKTNALSKAKQKLESEKERKNSDAAFTMGPHSLH